MFYKRNSNYRIIHNTPFKGKVSLDERKAQKEDRFLHGRQIAYLIYEYFRVTGANDSFENYADLFTIALRNDDIQEFDPKWDGILLSMTKNSRPYWNCTTWRFIRRKQDLIFRLKTMVKRSIEQDSRNRNFEDRNGKSGDKTACTKNSWRLLAMGSQRAVF